MTFLQITVLLGLLVLAATLPVGSDRVRAGGAAYIVDNTSDDPMEMMTACDSGIDNDCSLRGAIANADAAGTFGDTISFDASDFPAPPLAPGAITISVPLDLSGDGLDTIDGTGRGVVIDGGAETRPIGCLGIVSGGNTIKAIQLTDCNAGIAVHGNNNTIGPGIVAFDNTQGVVIISGANGNVIKGNMFGTNAEATAVHPDGGNDIGVSITSGINTLGGPTAGDRNIISGNTTGVNIQGNGTTISVLGNYIGTDLTGTLDLGNVGGGINLAQATDSILIGGANPGEGNLISGNDGNGIRLFGNSSIGRPSGTRINNNLIGTDINGTADLGNGMDGVLIDGAVNTCVGGHVTDPVCGGPGNVISGNGSDGVQVTNADATGNRVVGNKIGTELTGTTALANNGHGVHISSQIGAPAGSVGQNRVGNGNTIAFNGMDGVRVSGSGATGNTIAASSIHSNTAKGIENISAGNNEPGHAPPAITVGGPVSGTACVNCTVDVYSDNSDEGRVYHGSTTADGAGNWSFPGFVAGPNVTATATNAGGSTSEFSAPSPADSDADGFPNTTDNCPFWPNPSQTMPAWALPADDPDCDGFTTAREGYLTTDPAQHCAATGIVTNPPNGGVNDEPPPDFWPLDMNDNQQINTVDVGAFVGKLGLDNTEVAQGWTARLDLNQSANGIINTVDVGMYVGRLGNVCSPSGP